MRSTGRDPKSNLLKALQSELNIDLKDAEELSVLGRWLMNECKGITRASKRLYRMDKNVTALMAVLKDLSDTPISDQQRDALHDISRAFHIR